MRLALFSKAAISVQSSLDTHVRVPISDISVNASVQLSTHMAAGF
jgi:hypothetical protein